MIDLERNIARSSFYGSGKVGGVFVDVVGNSFGRFLIAVDVGLRGAGGESKVAT